MLKGAQKQMIVVRTGDSQYFDEAYFVLRREVRVGRRGRSDLLREANRILEEGDTGRPAAGDCRRGGRRGWLWFLLGALLGAALVLGIVLLL